MLVSTFELLVKPQLPKNLNPPPPPAASSLSRTVIQGYFLTIANVNNFDVKLSLVFTALTPSVDIEQTFAFIDIAGSNIPGDLQPHIVPGKASIELDIPANDTILFILQPDIIKNEGELLTKQDFEVRGYVEILLSSLSFPRIATLLITPEQRATFFKDLAATDPQLDQIIYNLPTATGSSLFTLANFPVPNPFPNPFQSLMQVNGLPQIQGNFAMQ